MEVGACIYTITALVVLPIPARSTGSKQCIVSPKPIKRPLHARRPTPLTSASLHPLPSTCAFSGLANLILLLCNSLVTNILLKLCPSSSFSRPSLPLELPRLPASLTISLQRLRSYRLRQMAIRGTQRRRSTIADMMPMIARGDQPSLWEAAVGAAGRDDGDIMALRGTAVG